VQHALQDVSFAIKRGEFFGVIGRNGSGKSTLLKILAGIYRADRGSVELSGKLSPFIELGVGFNPDLNARDNVRINGTLLGLSPRNLARRFDEIIAFAELERFVDQSLKNYSSGMQLRLAYAIAIQVPFDVLLLDEVLAVGDQNFQEKCFETFERMREEGKTVVLVTHGLDSVVRFCDRALLLRDGTVQKVGTPQDVIDLYLAQERARASGGVPTKGMVENGDGGKRDSSGTPPESRVALTGLTDPSASVSQKALRDLTVVVQRSREQSARHALNEIERVILDQRARLDDRAARLQHVAELRRETDQLLRMLDILLERHYENFPLPPEHMRLRIGKTGGRTNFLAQGLTAADRVTRVFGQSPCGPVLEWGCGPGRTARWLIPYSAWSENYYGCDVDPEAIAWLRNEGCLRVTTCGQAPPLEYPDQMFAGAFTFTNLIRSAPEAHRGWYAELYRLIKPEGRLFVTTLGVAMARQKRGSIAADFNLKGHAYVSGGERSAAYVSPDFTRIAAEGFFMIEEFDERSHGVADTYVLKRVGDS
jgi:ABC-type polysaccharide/polyol phosphate transport system ATPase subunit/SAM-dependent methyltransferase